MDKYAELRAALGDGSFDFDQRAYMNEVRALLAERDAFREALTCIARIQTKPGDGKAAFLLASVINLAFAALAQEQGESMTTKTDGGAAFPVADHPSLSVDPGMTLRDYFAAKAMQALIVGCTDKLAVGPGIPNDNKRISIAAFSMADAMLAAREKKS